MSTGLPPRKVDPAFKLNISRSPLKRPPGLQLRSMRSFFIPGKIKNYPMMNIFFIHYTHSVCRDSLVADFGGLLGLFLGFSFMTLWDGINWVSWENILRFCVTFNILVCFTYCFVFQTRQQCDSLKQKFGGEKKRRTIDVQSPMDSDWKCFSIFVLVWELSSIKGRIFYSGSPTHSQFGRWPVEEYSAQQA